MDAMFLHTWGIRILLTLQQKIQVSLSEAFSRLDMSGAVRDNHRCNYACKVSIHFPREPCPYSPPCPFSPGWSWLWSSLPDSSFPITGSIFCRHEHSCLPLILSPVEYLFIPPFVSSHSNSLLNNIAKQDLSKLLQLITFPLFSDLTFLHCTQIGT